MLIDRDMKLPEIIGRYPSCRQVFDRYGLLGCGGPLGPNEPVSFFARAHRVDEARLLAELEEAAQTQSSELKYAPGPADVIYRRFFKAGIATMFTFGCVLGGINLAIMAARHQLAALDLRAVTWAHAHAQVAGWVTFFVMGFAYQAIPRFKFTALWRPALATWTLPVMAAALTVRTLAELWQAWRFAGLAAGALELAVVAVFVTIVAQTIRRSQQPSEPYERFLLAALGWMVAAFGMDLWVFLAASSIAGDKAWVRFISQYDAPWRDVQLLGFAGGMILGVSQRFLPFIYGFREVSPRTSRLVFFLWNLSVAGNILAYSMMVRTGRWFWGLLLEATVLGLLASVIVLVRAFGLFSVRVESDRSLPFLRAAYGWAMAALALLAAMPLYARAMGMKFSHAYFGGYRHAFTVGFISMMIVGVSSKVVPVLGGLDPVRLSSLRAAFWLLNIGSAMRVGFQILTDSQRWAFPWMGLSAWVEVLGLSLWAVDLWRAMSRKPETAMCAREDGFGPDTKVFTVIHNYPETIAVFLRFGFSLINNPMAQRVFARSVSLAQACRLKHVEYEALSAALNEAIQRKPDLVRIQVSRAQ